MEKIYIEYSDFRGEENLLEISLNSGNGKKILDLIKDEIRSNGKRFDTINKISSESDGQIGQLILDYEQDEVKITTNTICIAIITLNLVPVKSWKYENTYIMMFMPIDSDNYLFTSKKLVVEKNGSIHDVLAHGWIHDYVWGLYCKFEEKLSLTELGEDESYNKDINEMFDPESWNSFDINYYSVADFESRNPTVKIER